ncbi:MAG: polysaccharide pyruvyl transferase family protein [Gemmatimonadaceae bacterium]
MSESPAWATRHRPAVNRDRPRIGVIYPSGWGNLGDEAILQATFEGLREQWPDASLHAFTLHPERTAANHRVEADYLTGINRPMFGSPRDYAPLLVRITRAVARRTSSIPLVRTATAFGEALTAAVVYETAAMKRAWQWLQTADLVLAAGGGQLDAVWGGTWGQPYALARWAWLARRARVPFAFLSVGYGGVPNGLSKRMLRYAVANATYCSVRDIGSRVLALQLGVRSDLPVVPDLAFALEPEAPLPPRRPGYDVAISPMVYLRPTSWPREDSAKYQGYVALWAELVADRIARGDRVHLFVSDPADMGAVDDVLARLDEKTRTSCSIARATTPDALLEFFRGMDVVLSSRLHGVLLAIVACRPVLALSHERKVRAVMTDAGVASFCVDLNSATLGSVSEGIAQLTGQLDACARGLREYVIGARTAVKQQQRDVLPRLLRRR